MVTIAILAALAAAGPVTVEIVTSGHVETPAERYRVTGSVLACAATQAEADAQLVRKTAAIEHAMTALGATRASAATTFSLAGMMSGIMASRTTSECNVVDVSGEAEAKTEPADGGMAEARPQVGASGSVAFDAADRAGANRLIAALKTADAKPSDKPVPVLLDETVAKRAAKQQALAKATVEAAAYAAPLGLSDAVLIRISERQDLGSLDFIGQMVRTIGLPGTTTPDTVMTDVTLTVEFRLGKRR